MRCRRERQSRRRREREGREERNNKGRERKRGYVDGFLVWGETVKSAEPHLCYMSDR